MPQNSIESLFVPVLFQKTFDATWNQECTEQPASIGFHFVPSHLDTLIRVEYVPLSKERDRSLSDQDREHAGGLEAELCLRNHANVSRCCFEMFVGQVQVAVVKRAKGIEMFVIEQVFGLESDTLQR